QECSALGDMPGSFVPTVTAITTSQDLQWLVQPTLISSVAPGAPMAQPPPLDPYDLPGPSYSRTLRDAGGCPQPRRHPGGHPRALQQQQQDGQGDRRTLSDACAPRGPSGTLGDVAGAGEWPRLALTALSPQETDQLEEEKAELESEIAELRKEKERLEFVLVAHAPACKVPFEDIGAVGAGPAEVSSPGKAGTVAFLPPAPFQGPQGPFPGCCLPPGVPAGPPNATPAFVFTHPEGATCGASHQRSSSSDQSSDSLNSPSLLAL
ncbi:FOS protein, partial [Polioptila caerulea]|nr:FOS protein [Polioptila caerulea]